MAWLYALHVICDQKSWRRWSYPFVVIGANSILIYVMSWTVGEPIREMLIRHFGERPFSVFGPESEVVVTGACTMLIMFMVLLWLYRKRVFIKL